MYATNSVIFELDFDVYSSNSTFTMTGINKNPVLISGLFTPLYTLNRNTVGVTLGMGSMINMGTIAFHQTQGLRNLLFLIHFTYEEELPTEYILLERGSQGASGYLKLSIISVTSGRQL